MISKDSQTLKNLLVAFAGESQARNRYTFYAEAAKREGLETTAELFEKLARNEEQHAKFWFKYIRENFEDTEENLRDAIAGEHYEWTDMYMRFAVQAKDEGYDELAIMFERVAGIEKNHENKFIQVLNMLEDKETNSESNTGWVCKICGHVENTVQMPEICPVCKMKDQFVQNN